MRMHPYWAEAQGVWSLSGSFLPGLWGPGDMLEWQIAAYLLPFTFTALVVVFIVWRLQRREWQWVCEALKQATEMKRQSESELNRTREELFRRLNEDREFSQEKFQ